MLSDALARHPAVFDPLFVALTRVGEKSGEVVSTLTHYQKLLERNAALKRKVRQALAYPVFVLAMLVAIVAVLFFFSLPRFVELYADLGAELPGPTRVLIGIVDGLSKYGWVLLIMVVAAGVAIRSWKPSERVRLIYEDMTAKVPVVGQLRNFYLSSLCCHTLYSLLASGMTVVDALRYVAGVLPSIGFSRELASASEKIQHGAGLVRALRERGLFTPSALKLLEAGERSGSVPLQLLELAQYYDRMLEYRMGTLISLFEPMLILVTGIIVGAAVVAMYLPVFGMAGSIS